MNDKIIYNENPEYYLSENNSIDVHLEPSENGSLRSDSINELIYRRETITSKFGLIICLISLFLIIISTKFISYPDIIYSNAVLSSTNGPKELISIQQGRLIKLFVKNDDSVLTDQMIGWIESTAEHKEMISLSNSLDQGLLLISENKSEDIYKLFRTPFRQLGEIQPFYQQFIMAMQQFNDYLLNGFYYKKKKSLLEDYGYFKQMSQILLQQKQIATEDLNLSQQSFTANDSLFKDKVISRQDIRDQRSKLINKEMALPQLDASLLTNQNQQANKLRELFELEHTISQQKTIFQQSLQTLKSYVDEWKNKYIIKSPIEGKVVFLMPLQVNQFIQQGRLLGYINPFKSEYIAHVTLPQSNFGKVNTGQRVQLRFDSYPYAEFGFVEGKLTYISRIPSDSGFLGSVGLLNGLKTNLNQEIQYRSGLKSQALIITQNSTLLQRIYFSIIRGTSR